MQMDFSGKNVLVSGGGSGIGKMTALRFAEHGAQVAILDLNEANTRAVVEEIKSNGGSATGHVADLSSIEQIDRAIAEVRESTDKLDVLFANVGMPNPHGIDDITEADWNKSIDVNLKSNFFLTQRALPLLRASQANRSITYTASAAGLTGSYTTPLYSLTKAALVGLTRSLAIVLAPEDIRVNAVCPGPVATPMLTGFMAKEGDADSVKEVSDLYSSRVPLARVADPREIADAVLYLASDYATYVTGVPLPVDGGYTTQ